ncbi:MAG TPA: SLC13 family permease [Coprobacter fastidiosus]|uniref:SLC13 family permease n=2 Tax=Coprobacter fastidiosus TaxID=1099853 RepID=UPI001D7BA9E9|nr:SLC13 family permease [Coprobacter fastidiosus]HJF42902.1 SLC13 family permease [Coprobacter fastidiosus]
MSIDAIIVLTALIAMLIVLAMDKMRPGLTLLLVAIGFMLMGIITPKEMVAGFSNQGMITVAILFLVSEGVRRSGALDYLIKKILPQTKTSVRKAQFRMLPTISFISAFLNNTAVVVIFAPIIKKWAEFVNMPSQKFLIPLSYATILGGLCTLIGTSTNLVVHGMMQESGYEGLKMFELSKIGIIITIAGLIYIFIASKKLLPGNNLNGDTGKEIKEYYFDAIVPEDSLLTGAVIDHGHFKEIPQMSVYGVYRNNSFMPADKQRIILRASDQIILAGKSSSLKTLISIEGIKLTCLQNVDKDFIQSAVKLVEVVLGPRFPGIGQTLGKFDFFRHYGGIVTAVNRNGERITTGLNKLKLQEGDNLVLLTDDSFISTWGDSKVFYLVSDARDFEIPQQKSRRWLASVILIFMIVGATIGEYMPKVNGMKIDMFYFAAAALFAMTALKIFPAKKYTKYVSWDVLIAIASAFAISQAMTNSGIANIIAGVIIDIVKDYGPHAVLAALFLITNICTETITNNAAAALTFPIALSLSTELGVDPMPFFITICVAASASFSIPIGYQTNLIVQSVGGYKFKDFLKIGLPLNLIIFILSIILIPLIWEFTPIK